MLSRPISWWVVNPWNLLLWLWPWTLMTKLFRLLLVWLLNACLVFSLRRAFISFGNITRGMLWGGLDLWCRRSILLLHSLLCRFLISKVISIVFILFSRRFGPLHWILNSCVRILPKKISLLGTSFISTFGFFHFLRLKFIFQ